MWLSGLSHAEVDEAVSRFVRFEALAVILKFQEAPRRCRSKLVRPRVHSTEPGVRYVYVPSCCCIFYQ